MSAVVVAREEEEEEIIREEQEEKKGWSDLPRHLLDLISLRLYAAGDSTIFSAVCKSWQLIPQPPPVLLLNETYPQLRNIPYMMNFNRITRSFHLHHPITNDTYMVDIPELAREHIRFSKDGWVIICSRPEYIFFFNPFTRRRIEIPEIPMPDGFRSVHFSCSPTLLGCTVFAVFHCFVTYELNVGIYKHGGKKWYIQNFETNEDFLMSKTSPVLCNGFYYCLGVGGNLGIYDPEKNRWRILGKPLDRLKKCEQSFLLESDGDLYGVFIANEGRKIEVLRAEKSSNEVLGLDKCSKLDWHEVKSLDNKTFYLCYGSSYAYKSAIGGTRDKICFPIFYDDEILFYSLQTRRYHSFGGKISKKDFLNSKQKRHGVWINMPIQEN